jgi:RHS repeat-associated protein
VKAGYRYGFNGQEKDNEVMGEGNSYGFEYRMYDARIGRWFSTDLEAALYSDLSTYCFAGNSPILFLDNEGNRFVNPYAERYNEVKLEMAQKDKLVEDYIQAAEENGTKLKRRDIRAYKKSINYNSTQRALEDIGEPYWEVEDYFYTLKVTNEAEYLYFENLRDKEGQEILISVHLKGKNEEDGAVGKTKGMQVAQYADGTYAPTSSNGIIIVLYTEGKYYVPEYGLEGGRNYATFTNELGDIQYMFKFVKDKPSLDFQQRTCAPGEGQDYYNPEGAGVYSTEYQNERRQDVIKYKSENLGKEEEYNPYRNTIENRSE